MIARPTFNATTTLKLHVPNPDSSTPFHLAALGRGRRGPLRGVGFLLAHGAATPEGLAEEGDLVRGTGTESWQAETLSNTRENALKLRTPS